MSKLVERLRAIGSSREVKNGRERGPMGCATDWELAALSHAYVQALTVLPEAADRIEALEAALKKIAAFEPKHGAVTKMYAALDAEWNRAGKYAADIARKALGESEQ